jgi:hypothetical protein
MSTAVEVLVKISRGGEEEGERCEKGDIARCFPLSMVPWPFTRQPPASIQCRRHIWRLHSGCMRVDLQRDLPRFVQKPDVEENGVFDRLDVAEGAVTVVGCAGSGMERVGEDGGDEEANQEVGWDNLASTHAKNEQWVPFSCFL